jgi:hypothetical protein
VHNPVHNRFLVTDTHLEINPLPLSAAFLTNPSNQRRLRVARSPQQKLEREFSWHVPK